MSARTPGQLRPRRWVGRSTVPVMWNRRRKPDPEQLGDLTLWETDEHVLWAEMTPDPKMADDVEAVKDVLRQHGWSQTAGD